MFNLDPLSLIIFGVIILISLTFHEYAHAWMANRLGDPTPKLQGRLTLNPLAHLDIAGALAFFIIWFWWAKPVMINPSYFRDPVKGDFLTAMAWPAMNLLLAAVGVIIMMVYGKVIWLDSAYAVMQGGDLVSTFWLLFITLNIALAAFNLLPIYPFDGYRIIKIISPKAGFRMERNGHIISIIVIILILTAWRAFLWTYISTVTNSIRSVLFMLFWQIFY